MDLKKKKSVSADDELERLRYELEEEKRRKSRIGKTIDHLEQTIEHLTKSFEADVSNDECQKWRTKYETQAGLNWKLEDEIQSLSRRIIEANQLLKEKNCLKRRSGALGRMPFEEDTGNPYEVKLLERERLILEGELRNAGHRLDRESQRYFKLDEKCRQIEKDIAMNSHRSVHQLTDRQQQLLQPTHHQETKKHTSFGSPALSSSSYFVRPNHQRCFDAVNHSSGDRNHPTLNDHMHRKNLDQRKPRKSYYNNY